MHVKQKEQGPYPSDVLSHGGGKKSEHTQTLGNGVIVRLELERENSDSKCPSVTVRLVPCGSDPLAARYTS